MRLVLAGEDREHTVRFDDADEALVAGHRWYVVRDGHQFYAYANVRVDGRATTVKMHRLIMAAVSGRVTVDHRNRDGLDNRRANLRLATVHQQQANTASRPGKSRHKGVYWNVAAGRRPRWHAQIRINGRRKSLGYFDDEDEAGRAYDAAAIAAFGEFAHLNFPA